MKAWAIIWGSIVAWSPFAVLCMRDPPKLDYVGWKTINSGRAQARWIPDEPTNIVPYDPFSNSILNERQDFKSALIFEELFPLQERSILGEERFLKSSKNITGNVGNAITLFTSPQGSLGFLFNVSLAYVLVQAWWIFAHLVFWDYSTTLPSEEFSTAALVGFLKNTDAALFNQLAIWGTGLTASILFLLPPLILNLFPNLAEGLSVMGRKKRSPRGRRSLPLFTETDIKVAIRKTLCPLCLARLIVFNTLAFLSSVVLWNVTPFLRNDGSSAFNSLNLVRRKRQLANLLPLNKREEEVNELAKTLVQSLSKFQEV